MVVSVLENSKVNADQCYTSIDYMVGLLWCPIVRHGTLSLENFRELPIHPTQERETVVKMSMRFLVTYGVFSQSRFRVPTGDDLFHIFSRVSRVIYDEFKSKKLSLRVLQSRPSMVSTLLRGSK